MGANMLRSIERGAEGLAKSADAFPAGGLGASEAIREPVSQALDALNPSTARAPGVDVAKGPTRVEQLVRANPQALGPYAAQLQAVADDPARLRAKIANLSDSQPMFRRLLAQMEADNPAPDGLVFTEQ